MTSNRIRRFIARTALAAATVTCAGLVADGALVASSADAVAFPTGTAADPAVAQSVAALNSLQTGNAEQYASDLAVVAATIGPRVGVDPDRLAAAWTAATPQAMTAVLSALSQLGVSYHYATATPGASFDCSGLVRWAWSQAGVELPSNSTSIIRSMENTPTTEIEPGDVLWYPGHVMLALGVDDTYVHAVGRGKVLEVHSMYAKKRSRLRVIDPAG